MSQEPIKVPSRMKLAAIRPSVTHKAMICGFKVYVTVSFFQHESDSLKPAEVFVKVAKHGSLVAGLIDAYTALMSVAMQHGVPWEVIRVRMMHHVFERKDDPNHTSLIDGLAKTVDRIIFMQASTLGIKCPEWLEHESHIKDFDSSADDSE